MAYITPPPLPRDVIREFDRRAIEELGIPGLVLMENAGEACARFVEDGAERGAFDPPFRVICGSGNNAGDGFVIARQLFNRGHAVELYLTTPRRGFAPDSDAGRMLAAAEGTGVPIRAPSDERDPDISDAIAAATESGTIVDAIFGSGLSRPVERPRSRWIEAINSVRRAVVAVDIPSGLDADTGAVLGVAVRASHTLTFVAPKLGFTLGDGRDHAGEVHVVGISIPRGEIERALEGSRG